MKLTPEQKKWTPEEWANLSSRSDMDICDIIRLAQAAARRQAVRLAAQAVLECPSHTSCDRHCAAVAAKEILAMIEEEK